MKNFLRFLAFVLMVGSAYAQSNLPACPWFGYLDNCFGTKTEANGNKYVGEFKDGKYNGKGTFTYVGGEKYVGEFKDGKYNGQGTVYAANGSIINQGIWTDNRFVRSVPLLQANIANQTSATAPAQPSISQSNLPACRGYDDTRWSDCFDTFTFANGNKYVGEFKDGKYNGKGTLFSSNGSVISQGIWADGNFVRSVPLQQPSAVNQTIATPTDQLNISQSNLSACQGSNTSYWSNCFGSKTDPSGAKYVGEFKGGKRNGQGTFIFANGNKYVGEWREDKYNGLGTIYASSGTPILEGIWSDDRFVRSVPLLQANIANQTSATAPAQPSISQSNLPACRGYDDTRWSDCFDTFTFANGNKYVGEFKDGKYNGQGTFTYVGGEKYVGEFKDGKYNGQGTVYAANGSIINQGIWTDNRFVRSAPVQQASGAYQTPSIVAVQPDNSERDKLLAEVEVERKKRQELEEQLRVAQQSNKQRVPSGIERRVALVIGNSTYRVSPLDNPANDATDITNALSKVGFRTTLIRNATLGQMRDATRKFAEQLQSADVALIYFAGHGIESNRKNYMIPVNADLKFEYELTDQAYDAGSWLEMLETIKSSNSERVNIVILDACRNNNLIGSRSLGSGLGRMDAPTGTFLSYSTAPGKVAADGSKGQRNSPFTRHLLNVIQQPGLQIEEAFKEVRRNVSRDTKGAQVPWESTSLVGKFYFTVQR